MTKKTRIKSFEHSVSRTIDPQALSRFDVIDAQDNDDMSVDFYKEVYDVSSYQFLFANKLIDSSNSVFFKNFKITTRAFNSDTLINCIVSHNTETVIHSVHHNVICFDIPYLIDGHAVVWTDYNPDDNSVLVHIWGTTVEIRDNLEKVVRSAYTEMEETLIRWYYDPRRMYFKNVFLKNIPDLKNEYYPYIKQGVDSIFDQYEESTSTVLLLVGPPGTGKTSFIRSYIKNKKKKAIVSYDETIMSSDSFMLTLITDDEVDLLVIEDADVLLTSREKDKNDIMSKLLNVSDGLIKLPNKKIIFTTNTTQLSKIDDALMRPGRCFATINFRPLKFAEARVACEAAGVPVVTEDREYSLTEIFNQNQLRAKVNKIGFM